MSLSRHELEVFLNNLLRPQEFTDYCPNGLQVEGQEGIKKIAYAVSASLEAIEMAAKHQCQALVVHHGLFWKSHPMRPLIGHFGERVRALYASKINLFAYHLPLDAHPQVGNAQALAEQLELSEVESFPQENPLGVKGKFKAPQKALEFKSHLESLLDHNVILSLPKNKPSFQSLGIITGGAQNYWEKALEENLDAFLTGEISEPQWHETQEAGLFYFAGGHHATERFGIQKLQEAVKNRFQTVQDIFLDSPNPA